MIKAEAKSEVLADSAEGQQHELEHEGIERSDFIRIAVVAVACVLYWLHIPYSNYVGLVATVYGAYPVATEALSSLLRKRMTMELSMSIALVAALLIGESLTALIITLFVLVAEVLEKLTMNRGRKAIGHLLAMLPEKAFVQDGNGIREVPLTDVHIGQVIVVKPGGCVPVDGVVVSGDSYVDQSAITGESLPSPKTSGSSVFAGTINQSGTIDVQATGIGESTAFGKIIHAIEEAEHAQAPIQKTADRLAGYLVYFALACAALTFIVTHNITSTISVVIVAGACGIAAGTPLAILGGIGRAARSGAIVKGGLFLEALATIDTVVFDKTGTLTQGKPKVVKIDSMSGEAADEILRFAASAEAASEHPYGKAIVEEAAVRKIPVERPQNFQYTPGKGVGCQLNAEELVVGNRSWLQQRGYAVEQLPAQCADASEVVVGKAGTILGTVHIADVVRPEAKQAVSDLARLGVKVTLLTGDSRQIADAVAHELGISDVAAELLPTEKQNFIKILAKSRSRVAMVGDGINDAPALAEALVGVAIGSGTDVARECADVVLIGSDLSKLVDSIRIARRCKRIIMTNFVGTLVVDGAGVLLAAFGCLSPILAAFIHVSSELVFILNSARLLPAPSVETRNRK